jgi:hypothetical protein
MIQHTVAFHLNEATDETAFLQRAAALATIPGVREFQILDQVGQKTDHTHALSMVFSSQREYDAYNTHPDHLVFVSDVWIPNVTDFIELDYTQA